MKYFIKIFSFAKPYKVTISFSLLFSFLFVIMNTASLWMISSLLSTVLSPKDSAGNLSDIGHSTSSVITYLNNITSQMLGSGGGLEQIKSLCVMMLVIFFLKNLFFYLSNITMSYVNNRIIMDIRGTVFSHIQRLPLSFFHNKKVGEISSITMGDSASMRLAVNATINQLTKQPLNIIFMLAMLFLINAKMTLFSLIIIPLVAVVVIKIGQSIRRKTRRASKQIAGVMSVLHENLSGMEVVKSYVQENNEINKFQKEILKFFKLVYRQSKLASITTPINDMIGVTIAVLLLWMGGIEVFIKGNLDPDGFIKFIVYLFAMLQPAKSLAGVNLSIQASIASAERVFSILDLRPQEDIEDAKDKSDFKNNIIFDNISFRYQENSPIVLNKMNFTVSKGKTYALVGKSGSGKSTVINLLPRFYNPTSGKILMDGQDISLIKIESLRKLVGIVSQDTFLFDDSIRNNIAYGKSNCDFNNIISAAKFANADEFIQEFPDGYDTVIGERGVKLSGGQKQRVSIARAILKNPPILVLDEATSSLDTESEHEVKMAIDNLMKNRTVIVIAHRLSTIKNADEILVMDKGEIIERGQHSELIESNGKYKQLHDYQFDINNEN